MSDFEDSASVGLDVRTDSIAVAIARPGRAGVAGAPLRPHPPPQYRAHASLHGHPSRGPRARGRHRGHRLRGRRGRP